MMGHERTFKLSFQVVDMYFQQIKAEGGCIWLDSSKFLNDFYAFNYYNF